MDALTCTCGKDWDVTGMPQEEIEKRLAAQFGMPVMDIHELLDLLTDTLDKVLDLPWEKRGPHETETRMALATDRSVAWMILFVGAWGQISDAVAKEAGR